MKVLLTISMASIALSGLALLLTITLYTYDNKRGVNEYTESVCKANAYMDLQKFKLWSSKERYEKNREFIEKYDWYQTCIDYFNK